MDVVMIFLKILYLVNNIINTMSLGSVINIIYNILLA